MTNQSLPVGATPTLVIEVVNGDLSVVGWDAQELLIKADDENARIRQEGQTVYFSCKDDLTLRMPRGGSLEVRSVTGDMALRGVMGRVELKEIQGDLSIRDIGSAVIEKVNADFSLRGAAGDLQIKRIAADASVREVTGNVVLEMVAADLLVRGIGGNLKATAGADVVAYLEPKPDHEYLITAGDEILAILPPEVNATLNLNGDEIHVDLPDVSHEDSTSRVVRLGAGSAKVSLNAGRELHVSGQDQASESEDEFGNLAGAMFDWNDFGRDFGRELGDKISRRVQDATRRAERKMREADKKIRHVEVRMHHSPNPVPPLPPRAPFSRRSNSGWNTSGGEAQGPSASDEERMTILKMLQDKKITSDQADKLLSALEGGE